MTGGHGPQPGSAYETRLNELERHQAVTVENIRGIYNGLEDIREAIGRMQDTSKPNLVAMFMALVATISIMATVGAMALSPRDTAINNLKEITATLQSQQLSTANNRFTDRDGEDLRDDLMIIITKQNELNQERFLRNEEKLFELHEEVSP